MILKNFATQILTMFIGRALIALIPAIT